MRVVDHHSKHQTTTNKAEHGATLRHLRDYAQGHFASDLTGQLQRNRTYGEDGAGMACSKWQRSAV